jgi:transcriptional regulator with XRE-family HTH domain
VDWNRESIKRLYGEVGARVRGARKQHGWTQDELAHAVGLTRSSVANIEAGRQHALAHVVMLIARALDTPVEELLPSGRELDKLAMVQTPVFDLDGQPDSTQDFVTSAIRRAAGG